MMGERKATIPRARVKNTTATSIVITPAATVNNTDRITTSKIATRCF
jgi:hypothetical protein